MTQTDRHRQTRRGVGSTHLLILKLGALCPLSSSRWSKSGSKGYVEPVDSYFGEVGSRGPRTTVRFLVLLTNTRCELVLCR
jgi:hypothetical protein